MNSIIQDTRYLPHEINTRIYAVETYRKGNSVKYVCRKYHISKASLIDKSHKPCTDSIIFVISTNCDSHLFHICFDFLYIKF